MTSCSRNYYCRNFAPCGVAVEPERPYLLPADFNHVYHMGQNNLLITPYDGSGSFNNFLERFSLLSAAKHWDDNKKMRWLPVFLTGSAGTFYKELPVSIKNDWEQLLDALEYEFNNHYTRDFYMACLNEIYQFEGETVQQFTTRIEEMANVAYEGTNSTEKMHLLLAHFYKDYAMK